MTYNFSVIANNIMNKCCFIFSHLLFFSFAILFVKLAIHTVQSILSLTFLMQNNYLFPQAFCPLHFSYRTAIYFLRFLGLPATMLLAHIFLAIYPKCIIFPASHALILRVDACTVWIQLESCKICWHLLNAISLFSRS